MCLIFDLHYLFYIWKNTNEMVINIFFTYETLLNKENYLFTTYNYRILCCLLTIKYITADEPRFSLIILKRNVGWLTFFGTKLWHLYLIYGPPIIFIYVLKLKFSLVHYGRSQVYSTTISDEERENVALHTPPPSIAHLSPYKSPDILPHTHWTL